jgi:hypothetical protein
MADLMDVIEHWIGPIGCVYVTAYTTALDGLFYGYAKIFANEPEDMWVQRPLMKVGTRGFSDSGVALLEVERRVTGIVAELLEPHLELRKSPDARAAAQLTAGA